MRARKIPVSDNIRGTIEVVAKAYGLSIAEFNQARLEYLECEGYDSEGNEYETLHAWLVRGTTG